MPSTRTSIRAAVKQAIIDSGYTYAINDHTDEDRDFVIVKFAGGNEVENGLLSFTDAELQVGIFSIGADDDALDVIAEPIEVALKANDVLGDLAKGFIYAGFEYPDDVDERIGAIVLKFSIKY